MTCWNEFQGFPENAETGACPSLCDVNEEDVTLGAAGRWKGCLRTDASLRETTHTIDREKPRSVGLSYPGAVPLWELLFCHLQPKSPN